MQHGASSRLSAILVPPAWPVPGARRPCFSLVVSTYSPIVILPKSRSPVVTVTSRLIFFMPFFLKTME